MGLPLGVSDCIDNMWEEEEEQIREYGMSDSVWERLRNHPMYSPPPSPSSGKVFLISPQLYFSLPPPPSILISPTPQLHFSPPPTTSVRMSPYLDFPPPPPPRSFSLRSLFIECVTQLAFENACPIENLYGLSARCISARYPGVLEILAILDTAIDTYQSLKEIIELRLQSNPSTQHARSSPRLIASTDMGEIRQCHSSRPLKRNLEDSLRDFCSTVEVALKYHVDLPWWWRPVKLNNTGDVGSLCEAVALAKPNDLEYIPLGPFLPPKSPKMVSILSYLSIVKISRKISIRLLQVLPLVQLPQTLQIVIVEEKMTQLLTCSGEFISQDCSLVEERSVEITVEVDATNNGAHGVKAYENFPIVSHSEKKNTRDKFKRNYKSISVLTLEDLQQHFGRKREDVAKSFGVSVSTLKRICRQHGISRWPFQPERQKERLMEAISPSMHEKHDSSLRCIRTPLHARSLPRTMAVLDGGEMVQLDSSKQQSLVAFDITKNSAHLVRASQSCSTISHLDETNSRETLKRKCITKSVLSFEDLQQHFSCKLDDAAKALDVSVSTVKRICRKHGIPRWPSQKKRKVSKMDCILLELQGKKDVSPTCSKMPADGQTERGNEMVAHLQDQNEGPNFLNIENGSNKESITTLISEHSVPVSKMDCILFEPEGEKNVSPTCKTPTVGIDFIEGPNLSNIENHSNEESITTPTFLDFIPVFEKDCILLEPQGEKNVSPTHNTPTNGQTEVGNGMVRHIQDQNGIVPEFIEGPNLSNTENRSNEKSLTSPNFQDSIPGNYLAMDFSISSTYTESGEARGSSELAFQPKELTPSMAYPNPNAFVFTQPHISLREMLIENVGSSGDSRNFPTSAIGFFMGGHVYESSWTMPLCSDQAPMQTMTTISHIMPHLTEKKDIRTVTFKAQYRDKKIKFRLSLPSGIVELKKQVTNRLGELGSFEVHYQDNDNEWILIGCDTDVWDCFELSSSSGNEVVRLLVCD